MHNKRYVLITLAGVLLLAASLQAVSMRPSDKLKMLFFPSAACFFLPDGGLMVADFGKGLSPEMIEATKKSICASHFLYRLFSVFGWEPRVDWLIITSRDGVWDPKFAYVLEAFDITDIYFPFNVKKYQRMLGKGSAQLLMQVSLASYKAHDLSVEDINIAQSVSGVRLRKILPADRAGSEDAEDDGRTAVCFMLEYGRVRILVAGELTERQQRELLAAPDRIKADVFYHSDGLDPALISTVGAAQDVTFDTPLKTFVSDGNTVMPKE